MSEPKTIYCPKCGRKVATWDGRSTINISVRCKKCDKLVVYDVENEKVKIKEIEFLLTMNIMLVEFSMQKVHKNMLLEFM